MTQRFDQTLAGTEHHGGVLERESAGISQAQPGRGALEQRDIQRLLERTHLFAHGRLRDAEALGSTGDGALDGRDVKVVEMVVIQHEASAVTVANAHSYKRRASASVPDVIYMTRWVRADTLECDAHARAAL